MVQSEFQRLRDLDVQRLTELDSLLAAISKADPETLIPLRQFLLDAMFPSMPDAAREIMQPLFGLVTLEVAAIEQARSRLSSLFA
jgi:hypothetical protein